MHGVVFTAESLPACACLDAIQGGAKRGRQLRLGTGQVERHHTGAHATLRLQLGGALVQARLRKRNEHNVDACQGV